MGKVQEAFGNGRPGAVSRSIDDIIISVRNASQEDIPFGKPVYLSDNGAVPFDLNNPQEFTSFLGFTVRVADKTPDTYPRTQFDDPPEGVWHPGDPMEVLVRGSITIPLAVTGTKGGKVYVRKSDGKLTTSAGTAGSTIQLENVRVRTPRNNWSGCCEAVVTTRNIF